MEKHLSYFALSDALKEKGCPICFLLKKNTNKSMDAFLYEQVNDPGIRKVIRDSFGFCNRHAWQLRNIGDGLGLSIIYEDLVGTILGQIRERNKSRGGQKNFLAKLELVKDNRKSDGKKTKFACLFCKRETDVEKRYSEVLIKSFYEPEIFNFFKKSEGLCLPHLLTLLEGCTDRKTIDEIIGIESEKLEVLVQDLKEFQRKHDYRFSGEKYGKESDAWIRATEKLFGSNNIF